MAAWSCGSARIHQNGLLLHMANFIEGAVAEEPQGKGFAHENHWEHIRFHVENRREIHGKRPHQRRNLHSDILRRRVRRGMPGIHPHPHGGHLRNHSAHRRNTVHAFSHARTQVRNDNDTRPAHRHHHVRRRHGLLLYRNRSHLRAHRRPHLEIGGLRVSIACSPVARRVQLLDHRQLPAVSHHGRYVPPHRARPIR